MRSRLLPLLLQFENVLYFVSHIDLGVDISSPADVTRNLLAQVEDMVEVQESASEEVASACQIRGSDERLVEDNFDLALVDSHYCADLTETDVWIFVNEIYCCCSCRLFDCLASDMADESQKKCPQ